MSDIERYVDSAMYPAAEMKSKVPKVFLLWMTPDPLGAIAAACRMYKGIPTYSLGDITDEERDEYWAQVQKTELQAPLEFVKFHFFIEGVDRALTHQAVRQRTAVYAQESLRFAVKEDLRNEVSRPPSLYDPSISHSNRNDRNDAWDTAVQAVDEAYRALVANGVPAEDARGLLPQATLTRYNYCVDLRNLAAEAGRRLCTQAQFHWRQLFLSLADSIRTFPEKTMYPEMAEKYAWQFEMIADSNLIAPACYQLGHCGFKAEFDRGCTIRDRVDEFELRGVRPNLWDSPQTQAEGTAIRKEEWLEDPKAAWE